MSAPSLCPHIEKAKHNTEFSASLIGTKFGDWLIIGSFYIALQFVDAHAARNKVKFEYLPGEETLHTVRRNYVRSKLRHLFTTYERLFQESMNARYDPIYLKRIKFNPKNLFDLSQKFADIV